MSTGEAYPRPRRSFSSPNKAPNLSSETYLWVNKIDEKFLSETLLPQHYLCDKLSGLLDGYTTNCHI